MADPVSDPITIALIGAAGGVGGGLVTSLVTAIVGPVVKAKLDRDADTRTRAIQRVNRAGELLAEVSPNGLKTATQERAYRELKTAASAVGDKALIEYVGRMYAAEFGSRAWQDAWGDARHRAGELQRGEPSNG